MEPTRVCIAGGAGFIGTHLGKRLKALGYHVVAVGRHPSPFMPEHEFCHEFLQLDLRERAACEQATRGCAWVFNLAASVGGMGFLQASNSHSASILYNNSLISLHLLEAARCNHVQRFLFASSACVYPDPVAMVGGASGEPVRSHALREDQAWPAQPLDAYGLEKLYSEQACLHYERDFGLQCRIARLHNIYGPCGTWKGGKERAPAAFCRKAILSEHEFEMWGDGTQTRSFCYIDDCIEALIRLMKSDYNQPINIGSDELVTVNEMAQMVLEFADKSTMPIKHIDGPVGARGRNSDNTLIRQVLGWAPSISLKEGLRITFDWIAQQIAAEQAHDGDAS